MSLTSMVEEAQRRPSQKRSATPSAARTAKVDELMRRVRSVEPPERIAGMVASNPARARNELRSSCERVFQDDPAFEESAGERELLVAAVADAVFGMGPIEPLLADDHVTEVMVNGCRSVFVERDGVLERSQAVFSDDEQVRSLIDRIIAPLGRRIDEMSPAVDARLPQGHRVHAIIPPLALDGPVLTIRKFRQRTITLDEMQANGTFEHAVGSYLRWLVRMRKNVAVSGGTDSGKTTLLNAMSCEIDKGERIITIEDSAELRFTEHPHVVRLEARPMNAEGTGAFTIRQLVANALRMRPDRIVVGECRGAEALDMLQAMNTGHDGSLTTLHANSPRDAVSRLETLVRFGADLPVDVIEAQVASAIDVFVQVQRDVSGTRFVREIAEVVQEKDRSCDLRTVYRRPSSEAPGRWTCVPRGLDAPGTDAGEVALWRSEAGL